MKIGILSDTHLANITEVFSTSMKTVFGDVDMIIHAGDMTGIAVYYYLSHWELKAVRGNMDDYELRGLLPEKRIEEIAGRRIGIIHGRGSPQGIEDVVLQEFQGVDVVIFGHSHVPLEVKRGNVLLFNPGSFRGTYSHRGTVGIMEIDEMITFRHIEV
jgi:hypothetical protein